jgi:hypothetical protein
LQPRAPAPTCTFQKSILPLEGHDDDGGCKRRVGERDPAPDAHANGVFDLLVRKTPLRELVSARHGVDAVAHGGGAVVDLGFQPVAVDAFQPDLARARHRRKECRLRSGPSRIAKPAERVPAGRKEKSLESKGRYSE